MVNNETDLISSHQKLTDDSKQLDFSRWFRNFIYLPWQTRRCFNAEVQQQISNTVARAEQNHAGEIQVIIEGHLPLDMALRTNTRTRAKQLFAEYGVWDTAYNSGVLLYINLCERKVEIVADRGINHFVTSENWDTICSNITAQLKQKHYCAGVISGIEQIGEVLNQFYANKIKDLGNELSNQAIFL